jgi:hypothetical protein
MRLVNCARPGERDGRGGCARRATSPRLAVADAAWRGSNTSGRGARRQTQRQSSPRHARLARTWRLAGLCTPGWRRHTHQALLLSQLPCSSASPILACTPSTHTHPTLDHAPPPKKNLTAPPVQKRAARTKDLVVRCAAAGAVGWRQGKLVSSAAHACHGVFGGAASCTLAPGAPVPPWAQQRVRGPRPPVGRATAGWRGARAARAGAHGGACSSGCGWCRGCAAAPAGRLAPSPHPRRGPSVPPARAPRPARRAPAPGAGAPQRARPPPAQPQRARRLGPHRRAGRAGVRGSTWLSRPLRTG